MSLDLVGENFFTPEATLYQSSDDRYFVEDGIAYYAGDDSSLILYPDTQNGKCFSELYEFQNSSIYLRLEYRTDSAYVERKYEQISINSLEVFQYNHGTQATGTDVDFYDGEKKHYTIYDAAADHASNIELRQTLNVIAYAAGVVYYGAILYTCPLAAGPYVGVKALQLTGASDDFCNHPSFQDILPGFNACDLIEEFLHAHTMFAFGRVVSFSGSLGLEVISDTLMKTLLVDAKENFDSRKLPEAIDYIPSFAKVVSSKLVQNVLYKMGLNSIPYGGSVIIKQFVGHVTKDITKTYIHEKEFDYSKPSSKVLGNTVCKLIFPNSKTDIKKTFIYGICYKYVKFGAKELLNVSNLVRNTHDNNGGVKEES